MVRNFFKDVPGWVLVLGALLVAAVIAIGVWHLLGGGMASLH
jgi:hypothetical protein